MRTTVGPSFPLMARSGAPDCAQVQSMSHAGGAKEDSASEEMIRGNQPHSEASRGSQGPSASEEIQIELDDGADHLDAVGTSQTPETPGFRSQLHGSQLQLLAETTVEWPALVVAGRVVLLHGREGSTRAVAGDSRLPTLRRVVVSQRAVSDHNMDRYAMALRSVWRARGHVPTTTPPVRFAPARTPTGQWKACNVCGSDVIWVCAFGTSDASLTTRTQASAPACMYVLTTAPSPPTGTSDASRVGATHNCRGCGHVVCAFCAPAGDRVAGDALGEFLTLPDRRCPLPSRGHLEPVRVCRPCSYDGFAM